MPARWHHLHTFGAQTRGRASANPVLSRPHDRHLMIVGGQLLQSLRTLQAPSFFSEGSKQRAFVTLLVNPTPSAAFRRDETVVTCDS